MIYCNTEELKQKFFYYFTAICKYQAIGGYSLVPQNDHSVFFTTAGMQPLMMYLCGIMNYPEGNDLVNIQPVIRTKFIEKVGLDYFLTFFEVFGVWSIDYNQKFQVLLQVWHFLTANQWLGIPKDKLYITYFGGNDIFSEDIETLTSWQRIGIHKSHIQATPQNIKGPYPKFGLTGTNTKLYYDTGKNFCDSNCNVLCNCGKFLELWDVVFFDYIFKDGVYRQSSCPSIDMGAGVERLASIIQNTDCVYDTDIFGEIIESLEKIGTFPYRMSNQTKLNYRILADHLRCSVFILGDCEKTIPSSSGRGYVLRKIIRRAVECSEMIGIKDFSINNVVNRIIDLYGRSYPILYEKSDWIKFMIQDEYHRFCHTINKNMNIVKKKLEIVRDINQLQIKNIYQTYGIPYRKLVKLLNQLDIQIIQ